MNFAYPSFFLVLSLLFTVTAQAQEDKLPSKPEFSYSVSKEDIKVGDEVELIFKADVPDGWYIYSNDFNEDLGPILFSIQFTEVKGVELIGKPVPVNNKKKQDELWGGEVSIFPEKVEFRQKVKITSALPSVAGNLEYQMCSETSGVCVLHHDDFRFTSLKVTK